MKRRMVMVTALVVMLVGLFGVSPAAASDYLCPTQSGGRVYNEPDSTRSIAIYSTGCGYSYNGSVPPGSWSNYWTNFRDTDAFYVGRGYVCTNTATGYNYMGGNDGRWFWLVNDSAAPHLYCHGVIV